MTRPAASQNPPLSSGCTTSSMPPEPAVACTTPAAPATPACQAADNPPDDGWQRIGLGQIGRGPYRISKAFVDRRHIGISPIYHLFHRFAFLGAFPEIAQAKHYATTHEARHA